MQFPRVRRRNNGPVVRLLVLTTVVALVAAACGGGGGDASGRSADQSLIIGMDHVTQNYDPISATATADYTYWRFVYDTLVSTDKGPPEPWAAESFEPIDAKHWRFKLRAGMTFTNGEPLDAEAVRYTFQRALDDKKTPWRVRIEALQKMTIIDPLTIDFFLSTPVGNWPTRTSVVWLVPPKYTQDNPGALVTKPIGSGPFKLDSFTPGEKAVLSPNAGFWGTIPQLKRVELRSVPEESTRVSSLLAGDIDVAYRVLPDFADQVKAGGKKLISVPSGQSANIFFQTTTDTPLKDVRVRQAIDYAIDKKALLDSITQGYGKDLGGQVVGKDSVGYDPHLKGRPYDPAKAKKLLKEAGYGNGVTLAFDYSLGRYYRDKEIAQAISGYLDAVGITVKQNPLESGAWLDRLYAGSWGPINYWSIQDAPAYDLSWTLEIFRSDNIRKIDADPRLDQMLDKSFTITDITERGKYLTELAAYVQDQAYFVPFHSDPGLYAVDPSVEGVEFLPSTYLNLFDAKRTG
ncbi:ABC transporter substrate-binding protein [Actinophytocola sp.]|uniref:ABC transporter substrate-binding protein n=1 Tax=Actinophytocola sp. TaxID=1872138 RepID=UPI002ED7D1F6